MISQSKKIYTLRFVLLFLLYFITAKIGLSLGAVNGFATLVWPPSGIALAFLVLWGLRFAPAIFLAAFLINFLTGANPFAAMGIGLGNTLEPIVGCLLLRHFNFDYHLNRVSHIFKLLFLAAIGSTTISALFGTLNLYVTNIISPQELFVFWKTWWLGDLMGVFIVAPLFWVWKNSEKYFSTPLKIIEACFLILFLVLTSSIIFFQTSKLFLAYSRPFFLTIPLIWAALRFSLPGCVISICLISILAIAGTLMNLGPFNIGSIPTNLTVLQSFIGVLSLSGYILAIIIKEQMSFTELLEEKVSERTQDLANAVKEQRKAQKKIEASEQKFRSLAESANDSIIVTNQKGEIVYLNQAAGETFGYSSDELIGKCVDILIPLQFKTKYKADFSNFFKILKGKFTGKTVELTALKSDGSEFPVEVSLATSEIDESLYIAILRDISLRLKSQNERERLFTLSRDLIAITDSDYKFIEINPAWERVTGYSREELIGSSYLTIAHPDDVKSIKNVKISIEKGEPIESFESRIRCKDGSYRIILTSAIHVSNENLIYSISKDITEYKIQQEAFENQKNKLNLALEAGKLGAWETNLFTNITVRNLEHAHIFGYKNLYETWNYEKFLSHVVEEDKEMVNQKYKEALKKGELLIECRIARHDNLEVRWILTKGQILKNENQIPIKVIGVVMDITERKKLELNLKQSIDELDQFAYVASHDLQEPLRMITSYLQLLENRYKNKLDKDANEFIEFTVDAAFSMKQLINDFLTYAHLGKDTPKEQINSATILEKTLKYLEIGIKESNAVITFDKLPVVFGNNQQLLQVFLNLLSNALKFHKKNEFPIIHIGLLEKNNAWIFYVKDNGIGIDPKYFERIFKLSQRIHSKVEYPGTGIGLAICKKVIEDHGGKIWVESEEGVGSTFYFTLPKIKENNEL